MSLTYACPLIAAAHLVVTSGILYLEPEKELISRARIAKEVHFSMQSILFFWKWLPKWLKW